jgi:short-subunit dehydrogenase
MVGAAGSRVLLTGASSGIGRELALELGRRGAVLAIAARRRERLEELAAVLASKDPGRPVVIEADLSRRGAAKRLADEAESALGGVDVLVNNAGGGAGGRICAIGDRDEGREAFEINYWSPLALISALVPAMQQRGSGAVVNVTSIAQISTWPGFGAYAATKAALAVATESLRLELVDSGVHVMEAIPGPVDTSVQGETRLAPGIETVLDRVPLGDPAEMARVIVRGLERKRAHVIYPRRSAIAYHLPTLARRDTRRAAARAARRMDPAVREQLEGLVMRTGSMGDPAARAARAEWEQRPKRR